MEIYRNVYLSKLDFYLKTEQIKIITGARRSGKSYFLVQIINQLKKRGIKEDHIIHIEMEKYENIDLCNPKNFHDYVTHKIKGNKIHYLFVDEVQLINDWERVINSLRLKNLCIFITGSNSKLLSGDMATLLSGRYIQFQMRNVTFKDYYDSLKLVNPAINLETAFNHYLDVGSYPMVLQKEYTPSESYEMIKDIFNSTILKDIVERYQIRDVSLLNDICDFMIDNVGHFTSVNNITNYLKTHNIMVQNPTVSGYLKMLQDAFVVEKVQRYDARGKYLLSTNDKYYLVDHSLMYLLHNKKEHNLSQIYENIVFNELRVRGYKVAVGRINEIEIDFIAEKNGDKIYIQVTKGMQDPRVRKREERSLLSVNDNFHKYIITASPYTGGEENGIIYEYLPKFLLKKDW